MKNESQEKVLERASQNSPVIVNVDSDEIISQRDDTISQREERNNVENAAPNQRVLPTPHQPAIERFTVKSCVTLDEERWLIICANRYE